MPDIELMDEEAVGWFAAHRPRETRIARFGNLGRDCRPRLHLVVGDSIAKHADLASRFNDDRMHNRARGGETWESLLCRLDFEITAWQTAAAAENLLPGIAIIWLTGNELYSRLTCMAQLDNEKLAAIERTAKVVIARLREKADDVLVFGPLPRPAGEALGVTWEYTVAYHLERTLLKMKRGKFIPLGRNLTRKMGRNRHGLLGSQQWFLPDGVHLSPEGYDRLADAIHLPVWVTIGAGVQPSSDV